MTKLGILGTGDLASFCCEGLRRANWDGQLLVSPHSPVRARELADRFDGEVAESNQAVVDGCDIVLIAVRPGQAEALFSGLVVPESLIVLSAMAGVKISALQACAPGATIVRCMPVSSASINNSPTTLYPGNEPAASLLALLGPVIVVDTESGFEAATTNAAAYGWFIALLGEMIVANERAGLSHQEAVEIVTKTVTAAAAVLAIPGADQEAILASLLTPTGITEQGIKILNARRGFDPWNEAFDAVAKRLLND